MRDVKGQIIYVGKAVSLRKRVQSYFRSSSFVRGDPKLRGMVNSIDDVDFIVVRNEAEAVLTESKMIKDYKPYYNILLKDDKRFLLVRAEVNLPYPRFMFCRFARDDGAVYIGPFMSSHALKRAVDYAERKFGIRKCTPLLPDAVTYKHCINDIVRFCSAPCMGRVKREEYNARFQEACAFLKGERPEYIKAITEEMTAVAGEMQFEKAAYLRDVLMILTRTGKMHLSSKYKTVSAQTDKLASRQELQKALGMEKLPRVIEAFDISNISGTMSVASMVCSVDGVSRGQRCRRFRIKTVEGSNDVASMAEVVRRRYSRLLSEGKVLPDLVLVDGGLAQVNAAKAELRQLGLDGLAVAGLAKRYEELYLPGDDKPIRLGQGSPALMILQRLRDEAHRFANAYHQELRSRKMRESVLDEVPGVGSAKKQALLEKFGSVGAVSRASIDEIAAVSGIGPKLAEAIKLRTGC